MASRYTKHFGTKATSAQEVIPGREADMIANNGGGVSFKLSPMGQLDRFLILGSEGGTYYVNERKLTIDNAKNVVALVKSDGLAVVQRILEISKANRAPKREPAIFALAIAATMGDDVTRAAALGAVREVCRIPTDLFSFAESLQALGGWGRGKRNAIARWYTQGELDKLAYQVVKYRQRNGWTHRDLLRLSHPRTNEQGRQTLFNWIAKEGEVKRTERKEMPAIVTAFEKAQKSGTDSRTLVPLIEKHKLTWEMLPTEALNDPKVWPALLENMPMQAMVRMLGRMTANGTLTQFGNHTKTVVDRLGNHELLRKSGIHPMKLLIAQRTYASGRGTKGSLTWSPIPQISDALEEAFYASFGLIEPTGKRFLLGLDVSGSMGSPMGDSGITCAEGTAVMAMVTARLEKNSFVYGFADTFKDLKITAKDTLESATRKVRDSNFGATNCSLPMEYALQRKIPVDVFAVYTDCEFNTGHRHPSQALAAYRKAMGIPAKLVVIGMTATNVTIADPADVGMMDVVGFDGATPELIADFARN